MDLTMDVQGAPWTLYESRWSYLALQGANEQAVEDLSGLV